MAGGAAIVTGGASGIGAAVVDRLHAAGTAVACIDLYENPGSTLSLIADVTDEAAVVDAVAAARTSLGPITLAVLSAGTGGSAPIVDMDTGEWDRVIAVNARGTFLCVREIARAMVADGDGGSIVAVSSISGVLAERTMAHYAASKAAVHALVRVAAREPGEHGIRVNAVAPGTTDTPMFAATDQLAGYRDRVAGRTALGGVGTAAAVGDAILAVAAARWITGQVVAADGGLSLWSPIDPRER